VRAVTNYDDRSGRILDAGSIHDANDAFMKPNPDVFRRMDGSPLRGKAG
jgi:hypothetical protein